MDQKQIEGLDPLRMLEERFRSLTAALAQIVWTAEPDGRVVDLPEWRAYTGQSPEQVRGWGWLDAVLPEDRDRTADDWARAVATRGAEPYDVEYRLRGADGAYRWFNARGVPVLDGAGEIREWVGVCIDVDARKQAERALLEGARRSHFLAEASRVLASSLDVDATLRHVAGLAVPELADWCAVYDVRAGDGAIVPAVIAHSDPAMEAFAWDLLRRYPVEPAAPAGVAKALRDGKPDAIGEVSDALLQHIARDPEMLRLLRQLDLQSFIAAPIESHGRVFGAVAFYSATRGRHYGPDDVMLAEELARRAAVALENAELVAEQRRVEQQTRALLQSTGEGIYGIDLEGRCTFWNRMAEQLLGYTFDEVVGRNMHEAIHHSRADGAPYPESECPIFRATSDGRPVRLDDEVLWHKDGTPLAVEYASAPIMEDGRRTGAVVTFLDITERKRADAERQRAAHETQARAAAEAREEQLRIHSVELQRSNQELQAFAYVASHDLQEPLRKIQAFGDRLASRHADQLGDQGVDDLQRIQNAAGRMQTLINDLLAFSRVTTKAQPFRPVDLGRIVHEVSSDLEVRIAETGARVEVADLPTVDADPLQMRQLFQNLIGNALKFRRPEVPPVIRIRAERLPADATAPERVRVQVADNGIGFDARYAERIFGIFQRLHGRSEYEGTGVGLAIVRKIAERHGGSITAQGTPDAGATFAVVLPTRQAEATKHEEDDRDQA